ncbi:MAG: hypothetical protein GC189_01735 [Alphaproteobacteria bacterium]|nr:hypothetical protein [Alphaproteobacteria bacterium]
MAVFVHIATASARRRIERQGIKPGRALFPGARRANDVVFAFPLLQNYVHAHQWTREVLKWRRQPLIGVRFRVDDACPVWFGRYNGEHMQTTAAKACAAIASMSDPLGMETIFHDAVPAAAIIGIYPLRGVIGWRHFPNAHGRAPCGCPACSPRGEPNSRRLRQAFERDMASR